MKIFAGIFSTETVVFGLIRLLQAEQLWPQALASYAPPESMAVTVAARDAAKSISLRLGWTGDPTKRPGIAPLVKRDDEEEREHLAVEGDEEVAS